jgi:hypothetical protein
MQMINNIYNPNIHIKLNQQLKKPLQRKANSDSLIIESSC